MLQRLQRYALDAGKTAARVFGLSLITQPFKSLRRVTGRGLHEPLKIAIRQNRWLSLTRSLIHIVPVGFALFEIVLNWNEYYVGVDKYNQAYYQLIAKVHEIMIQASLGTIIFSLVRHELAVGEGLPFGALFSGLQLNQISYLWSMEYWGSIRSHHLKLWKKLRLAVMIALCVILGSLGGPSSAVLLIPRLQYWPAGSTHIWLNATHEQLWPSTVDISNVPSLCHQTLAGIGSNQCPWSEWTSILEFLSLGKGGLPDPYKHRYGITRLPVYVEVSGKSAVRRLHNGQSTTFMTQNVLPFVSTTQQAAVADGLVSAANLWFLSLTNVTARKGHGNPLSDQSDTLHTIKNNYLQPYVLSWCASDTIEGSDDDRPLVLPTLLGANMESQSDTTMEFQGANRLTSVPAITKSGTPRSKFLDSTGDMSQYRLTWVELSEDQFNGSSIGALIHLPNPTNSSSHPILSCNLAAGWGTSTASVQVGSDSGGIVSSTIRVPSQYSRDEVPIEITNAPTQQKSLNGVFGYPLFPQVPIRIEKTWADLLSPRLSFSNSTVINELMQQQMFPGSPGAYARFVLSGLVANGLARTGFSSILQGDVKTVAGPSGDLELDGNFWLSGQGDAFIINATEAQNWTKLRMESTLQGYSYNVIGTPPKIAIAVLMVYCVVAFCHIIYAGTSGISSTSWDSIAEVTALAMNSTPTALLRNTCAGITELHIFKLPVRIVASKDEEGEGEHLELVFGDVPKEKTTRDLIEPNRAYGTMPNNKAKMP